MAEADDFLPSEPGGGAAGTVTTGIPALLAFAVAIDDDGVATATWAPNAYCGAVRVRAMIHALGDDVSRPLPVLAEVVAGLGSLDIGTVPEGMYVTVDLEAWETYSGVVGDAGLLLADAFARADGALGGAWTAESGSWSISGEHATVDGSVDSTAENAAGSTGEAFVQATLRASVAESRPGIRARHDWNGGVPLAYGLELRPDAGEVALVLENGGTDLTPAEDGWVAYRAPVCAGTWAEVHDGDPGTNVADTGDLTVAVVSCSDASGGGKYNGIWRAFLEFDASALSGAESATLALWVQASSQAYFDELGGGHSVALVDASPSDPLVVGDYQGAGTTLYADAVTLDDIGGAGTAVIFTLNAAGLAALQAAVGGTFSVALRIEMDRTDSAPTWASNEKVQLIFASSSDATTAHRPTLNVVAGTLDTSAASSSAGTDYPAQLYVADGVQEAAVAGVTLSATDTTFDGQDARAAALHGGAGGGAAFDDVLWAGTKYVRVSGLPTDWMAQILDSTGAAVAEATEDGTGTAAIDASVYGGASGPVPMAGWPTLVVLDDYGDEAARVEDMALYPGATASYDETAGSLMLSGTEGRIYRASVESPVPTLATRADLSTHTAQVGARIQVRF